METKRPTKGRTEEIKGKPMKYRDLPGFNKFLNDYLEKRTPNVQEGGNGKNDKIQ